MKIKLHKRFRGLLSLLVTVMLLVSVIPLTVLPVHAEQCHIYFTFQIGNESINHKDDIPHIYVWQDSNTHYDDAPKMTLVSDSEAKYGYKIYEHTVNWSGFTINGIRFISNSSDQNDSGAWKTPDIPRSQIQDGYLYYSKDWKNNAPVVASFPLSHLTYKSLNANQIQLNLKDLNVKSTAGTFTQKSDRHYENAVLFDYFSDYELQYGQKRTQNEWYDSWEDPYKRMQFLTFDTALSTYYSNSATHPLYFGDIHDEKRGYYFSNYNENRNGSTTAWNLYYNNSTNGSDYTPSSGDDKGVLNRNKYQQLFHDNNSLRRKGENVTTQKLSTAAAQGLYKNDLGAPTLAATTPDTETRLKANAARLDLVDGKDAKWFNSTWLENEAYSSKSIGASYAVDFPFWEVKNLERTIKIGSSEYKRTGNYYYINSEDGDKALRLSRDNNGNGKYYLQETKQGIYNYTEEDSNNVSKPRTYGFFPFNDKSDFYTDGQVPSGSDEGTTLMGHRQRFDRTNYGFGVYLEIPFTLTNENGTVDGQTLANGGTPITFTFSGDDDLLVYIDGKLALDIGGPHDKVQGEINLATKQSWVSSAKTDDGQTSGVSWSKGDGTVTTNVQNITVDSGAVSTTLSNDICAKGAHVMEIFYVERGLFNSNMEIMYNLPVVENRSFTVRQSIDTSGVNDIFVGETTGDATVKANLADIEAEMNIQFSKPTKDQDANTDFSKLLGEQAYPGHTPAKYLMSGDDNTQTFTPSGTVYTARVGNGKTLTYINDFIKSYNYNINLTQSNTFYIKGTALTGSSDLFTTTWTLAKKSGTATAPKSGYGPVTTTSTSSRPVRATKTTSTSAGVDNSNSFDFHGTTQNPDAIVFESTMQTADLTINKTITNRKPSDTGNPVTFTFKVTFDDVGGIALEDVRGSGGAVTTDRQIQTSVPVTVSANSTTGQVVISGIPVNTKYKIEETGNNSYTASYSGTVNTNWQTLTSSSGGEAIVTNNYQQESPDPVEITLQIQKIWSDSTNMPEQVKFKLQYSTDGGSTWSNVTASSVTNGDVTLTASTASVPNGGQRVVWTMEISGSSITDITSGGGDIKYRIQEYKSDGTTLITETGTEYDENWISNYNFSVGATIAAQNEKLGSAKDAKDKLLLAVLNTHPTSNPTNPETGGRGGYIPIAGGFIAILLAGAGYFIYKKRLLV